MAAGAALSMAMAEGSGYTVWCCFDGSVHTYNRQRGVRSTTRELSVG
jgi:hypothetical protein